MNDDLHPADDAGHSDLATLARFRDGRPGPSPTTLLRARSGLDRAVLAESGARRGGAVPRPAPRRRAVLLLAAAAALAAGATGLQVVLPGQSPDAAAVTLSRAAAAAGAAPAAAPGPGQFLLVETVHHDGSERRTVRRWVPSTRGVDGLLTITGGVMDGRRDVTSWSPGDSLATAPYDVLAALPTDPHALLEQLRRDPAVVNDRTRNLMSDPVAVWGLLRDLLVVAPPAQKRALLEAAALLPGMRHVDDAVDALGRHGEAVSLVDPRLGPVRFVFDRDTHAFLGEVILQADGAVQFSDAVRPAVVVDRAGATA